MRFEGVYTPIVAPFGAATSSTSTSTARLVEFHARRRGARAGSQRHHGRVLRPVSSRSGRGILEHARDVAAGRAQLIAGCNAPSTREVIRHGEVARELGYDALLLAAPPTSLPSQRELAAHYTTVADAVGLPIVLYNFPARAGVEIGLECLDAIADHPLIAALKESSGDFSRFLACAAATRAASMSSAAPTTRRSTTSRGACAPGWRARRTCCRTSTWP